MTPIGGWEHHRAVIDDQPAVRRGRTNLRGPVGQLKVWPTGARGPDRLRIAALCVAWALGGVARAAPPTLPKGREGAVCCCGSNNEYCYLGTPEGCKKWGTPQAALELCLGSEEVCCQSMGGYYHYESRDACTLSYGRTTPRKVCEREMEKVCCKHAGWKPGTFTWSLMERRQCPRRPWEGTEVARTDCESSCCYELGEPPTAVVTTAAECRARGATASKGTIIADRQCEEVCCQDKPPEKKLSLEARIVCTQLRRKIVALKMCQSLLDERKQSESGDNASTFDSALGSARPVRPPETPLSPQLAQLSAPDLLASANASIAQMQTALGDVVTLAAVAQQEKDLIKLNCVNDKLIQTRGDLAVGDQALASLNEDVARLDDRAGRDELARILALAQRVASLRAEAEACLGGGGLNFIGTGNTMEIDPSIPTIDSTDPGEPQLGTERPPLASTTL